MTIQTFTEKLIKWYEALPNGWNDPCQLTEDPRYAHLVDEAPDMVAGLLEFYGVGLYEQGDGHYFTLDQCHRRGVVPDQWGDISSIVCFYYGLLQIGKDHSSEVPDELDLVSTAQLIAALKRRCRRFLVITQLKEDEDNVLTYYRYPHGERASLMAMQVIHWEAEPGAIILRSSDPEQEGDDGEGWKNG